MKLTNLALCIASFAIVSLAEPARAETKYVDSSFGPNGDGTKAKPYDTIQEAINDPGSDRVIVYPGTYTENLVIKKSIKIYGYDGPHTTRISGSAGNDVISIGAGFDVTIEGLNISSGANGLSEPSRGTLHVRNCIFCSNRQAGIYINCELAIYPMVRVYNCISVNNGGSGIYVITYDSNWHPDLVVANSILVSNGKYGIEENAVYKLAGGPIAHDYNDVLDNASGQYSPVILNSWPPGAHSFSLAPDFIGGADNACNQDFRLSPTSSCGDKGDPGIGFLDPDATRNDIGAYGGPGARTFYTSPNDGPIIRELSINKGIIPKGETFTIRAKGAVR